MDNLDMETEYFRRAIEYYADEANGWGGQTRLSELYGCSNSYINMIIKKAKKPSYKIQLKFAKILNTDRDSLLKLGKTLPEKVEHTGKFNVELPLFQMQGQATHTPPQVINLQDEATKKHQIVIEGFKDREIAIKFNQVLVEIESLDAEDFQELYDVALLKLNKLREKKRTCPVTESAVEERNEQRADLVVFPVYDETPPVPAIHLINREGFILSSNITPMNSITGEDIVGTYACDHLHPACTEKFLFAVEECLEKDYSLCCVTLKTNDRWFAKMEKIKDNIVRVSEWDTADYDIVKLWDVI